MGREAARVLLCVVLAVVQTAVGAAYGLTVFVVEWARGSLFLPTVRSIILDVTLEVAFLALGLCIALLLVAAAKRLIRSTRRWSSIGVAAAAVAGVRLGGLAAEKATFALDLPAPHNELALLILAFVLAMLILGALAGSFGAAYIATWLIGSGVRDERAAAEVVPPVEARGAAQQQDAADDAHTS